MPRTPVWIAALATSALTVLAAGAANADDTTIIREHKVVPEAAPAPQPAPPPVTTTVHRTTSVRTTSATRDEVPARRHVVHRHHVVHHAATMAAQRPADIPPPPVAPAADQSAEPASATIDRNTVIHRDDNGDVSRHTVIEKQGSDGSQTTVEHHSTTPPDDVPPHP